MKKVLLLSTLLALFGFGGISLASATITYNTGSNISYTLNGNENFTAGTITITDGTDTITILDRNLGATEVGTGCEDPDGLSLCTQGDPTYGYHFQWGNNYGFPSTGELDQTSNSQVSSGLVNSGYMSGVFYYGNGNWIDDDIRNLRGGGETSDYITSVSGDNWKVTNAEERQGPCPDGFHVPSHGEILKLIEYMIEEDHIHERLLIPFAGKRNGNDISLKDVGERVYLWSSSYYSANSDSSWHAYFARSDLGKDGSIQTNAMSVRCFYNEYAEYPEPQSDVTVTFMDEGIVVTTGSIQKGSTRTDAVPTPDAINGYDFDYWYVDGTDTEFDFDTPFTQDTLLQAHRTFKARIPNGIYTGFNENQDITVVWNDETLGYIHLTLARNNLPGVYYWGWNEPANSNFSSYPTNGAEYNNNWGGGGDNIDNSYDDGNERYKRQGPCPDGSHIPSKRELNALAIAWCNIYEDCYPRYEDTQIEGITGDFRKANDWTENNKMIWMNRAGLGTAFRNTFNMGTDTDYRSSSPNVNDTTRAYSLWAPNYRVAPSGNGYRRYEFSIRCFKNYVAVPPIEIDTIFITGITLPVGGEEPTTGGISSLTEGINLGDLYRFNSSWDEYNSGFVVGQPYELYIPFTVASGYKLKNDFTATFSGYEANYVSSDTVSFQFIATAPNNPNLTVTHHTDSNISYTLNGDESFTGVGTITISDGTDTITILDRNLGASAAGTGCEDPDELSLCNQGDSTYGYHFQRGNNWGFDINDATVITNATGTQVPASEVNVGYSNGTFITGDNWIDDDSKVDMWGGSANDGIDNWKVTNPKERQGPCPEGFHVPSIGELLKMEKMMGNDALKMHEELLIPYAGGRDSTEMIPDYLGTYAYFWSSTPYSTSSSESLAIVIQDESDLYQGEGSRSIAISLRCFYNSYETYSQPGNNNGQSGGYSRGGSSNKSDTNDEHFSADDQDENVDTGSSDDSSEGQTNTNEFEQAYEFAYENGVTTMDTIEKADMEGSLTRIAMAKMLSKYAINVLGKKPANVVVPKFKDITNKLDEEYDNGVTLAYQLGIMGINMPNNKFRPNDLVTRAEFATALSRMLFSTPDGNPYYSTHLAKLKAEGIITNDNPDLEEVRGYVMIMLMRSAKN